MADLKKDGVDFSANLIVPEIDAATNEKLHQREDHNHLLKRIVGCIREGKIPGFNVIFLRDALHDPGRDNYDNSSVISDINTLTDQHGHILSFHNRLP